MIDPDVLDDVENKLFEITQEFEDLTDMELIISRNGILDRLNKVLYLLNEELNEDFDAEDTDG